MPTREQFNKFFQSKEHKEAIGLLERKCKTCGKPNYTAMTECEKCAGGDYPF